MRWGGRRTPKVAKLERKGKLDRLLGAAAYSDPMVDRKGQVLDRGAPVRAAAIAALAGYEPAPGEDAPDLVPVFTKRLGDDSPEVVRAAAEALAQAGSPDAAWALVDALVATGPDTETRQAMLDALRACACPGIAERWCSQIVRERTDDLEEEDRGDLETLMEVDPVADPVQRVFETLAPYVTGQPGANGSSQRAETVLSWCLPATVVGLTAIVEVPDPTGAAIRLAGRSGDQEMLTPLARLLEHPSPDTRSQAALALGGLADTAAVLPLMGATSDPELRVRQSAIAALDGLGSAGVTAALAVMAHTATFPSESTNPALGGRPWARTLARLTERIRSGARARRLAGLVEARSQYQALVGRREEGPAGGDLD